MAQEMPADAGVGGAFKYEDRQQYLARMALLQAERSSWLMHWYEIAEYIFPRRFRYLQSDRNKGLKRNDKIINNTPTRAARDLGAGKMAGMTSPARPWWEPDTFGLSDDESAWVEIVYKSVNDALARSNIYGKIHEMWEHEGTFATGCFLLLEDEETDVRGYSMPIGQYSLGCDARREIDTCYWEVSYTVSQLVEEFGLDNCSPFVQQQWKENKKDTWIEIVHAVEPNRSRETGLIDNQNMPFASVWFERGAHKDNRNGTTQDYQGFLRKGGYEEFPVVCARWFVTGEDVYGSASPGMDSLGDSKALQLAERRKATAVDMTVKPPMKGPASLRSQKLSLLPGDMNYVDEEGAKGKFEPAVVTHPQAVPNAIENVRTHEFRINQTFMVDLFRSMQTTDEAPNGGKQPITAREVAERHEEKMLNLGPVVEGDATTLAKMIDRIARILLRRGRIPPPPPTMRGKNVKIKFTSIMAQAQKLMGTATKERAVSFIGSLSAVKPEVLDIPNWDQITRNYFEDLGMGSDEINTEEVVAKARQQRAEAQAAQQQMQQIQQGADAAKVASQADLNGDNVLSRLLNTQGGGGGPIGAQ
jgi:hypothetical protein